jgi:translation initiation factor 1
MVKSTRLVYSTDGGKHKEKPVSDCAPVGDGVIRIRIETKGRKGKGVSVIWGFELNASELKSLAGALKQHCGTGGSVKEWAIEIQGDQRQKLKTKLESLGYSVKLAGG